MKAALFNLEARRGLGRPPRLISLRIGLDYDTIKVATVEIPISSMITVVILS